MQLLTSADSRLTPRWVQPLEVGPHGDGSVGLTARNLATIMAIGLPVPPGFTIIADAPRRQDAEPAAGSDALADQIRDAVTQLEARTGRRLGDALDPLLVSVRADPIGDGGRLPVALDVGRPGQGLPPLEQLLAAIQPIWDAGRPDVAVTVQAMVSGTRDERSGSGVVFTRDPASGSPGAYGRFLAACDGHVWRDNPVGEPLYNLRHRCPEAFDALESAIPRIETGFRDMCEVRFTLDAGELWILQARPGRRDAAAAVRIAVDLVDEGLISASQALGRVPAPAVQRLQGPVLAADQPLDVLGRGRPVAPGVAKGRVAFAQPAEPATDADDVVLVCEGIPAATGAGVGAVITDAEDGTRRLVSGPPAVSMPGLVVDVAGGIARTAEGIAIAAGDVVTVDGGTGVVVAGAPKLVAAPLDTTLARLLDLCDAVPGVAVLAEAPDGHVVIDFERLGMQSDLVQAVQAALQGGAGRLALRLPSGMLGTDPHPPPGPWAAVVADGGATWAARLIAARLALRQEFPPAREVPSR
jgi:pyruvate,orthophosphate dikinase